MSDEKPWTDVIEVARLEKNWVTRVSLGRRLIAVYDTPSGIYASLALCNHGGADLCDGYFDGHVIECPLHQGAFDVRTGDALTMPATEATGSHEVKVVDGEVFVKLAD